jgi:hypothetical protein
LPLTWVSAGSRHPEVRDALLPLDPISRRPPLTDSQFLHKVEAADRQRFLDTLSAELNQRTDQRGVHLSGTAWLVEAATVTTRGQTPSVPRT